MATFPAAWVRARPVAVPHARDRTTWIVAASAAAVSIACLIYFYNRGDLLAYFDTVAHMTISRQVLDNSTGHISFGQLGAVWLPLPHLLELPLVWNDDLFYSGLAGSFPSMAAYVVMCVYTYLLIRDLTGSLSGALVGLIVLAGNANVLYLQSVPMTEVLLFACIAAMIYYLQRWIRTGRWGFLLSAGVAANLGCATRYEAWIVLIAAVGVVAIVLVAKRTPFREAQDLLLGFVLFSFVSIGLWLLWNQLIFGNALTFQVGDYAKPSNWVNKSDVAVGNLSISAKTYWYAITDNTGLAIVFLGSLGLLVALARRATRLLVLPTLSVLVLVPFFIVSLYKGQRPLHVLQTNVDLYNVRFGLLILLPLAVGVGCLVGALPSWRILRPVAAGVVVAAVLVTTALQFDQHRIVLANEPGAWLHGPKAKQFNAASDFLSKHYHQVGGNVLAAFFGNEDVLFGARIQPGNNINEGSFNTWDRALRNPLRYHVRWIVMRTNDAKDPVFAHVFGSPVLTQHYQRVYQHLGYSIYERSR
jgi:hypothetical protein